MNSKKTSTFASMVLAGTALLGACSLAGGSSKSEFRKPDFRTVEFNENTSCKISFWHTMGQTSMEYLDTAIEIFHETYPNIEIEHGNQGGYPEILSKISKAVSANTTPTMAYCYPDHVATYGVGKQVLQLSGYEGSLMDITKDEDTFVPAFLEEGKKYGYKDDNGKDILFSVPFQKSTEVLFYNKTIFDKKGWSAPLYWENPSDPDDIKSFVGLAKAIKADADLKDKIPLGYDSDDNMFITMCHQYNIPYTKAVLKENGKVDKENSFLFNNSQAKEMVTKLKGWYDNGYIVTKGTLENNSYTSTKFAKDCTILMSIGSTGGTGYNYSTAFKAGVAQIPQQAVIDNSCSYGQILQGPSICFFPQKTHTDVQLRAAWEFYKFLSSDTYSAYFANMTGYEPVRTASYEVDTYDPTLPAAGDAAKGEFYKSVADLVKTEAVLNNYFTNDVFKGSAVARTQVGGIITDVFSGASTIDQAFRKAYDNCINS